MLLVYIFKNGIDESIDSASKKRKRDLLITISAVVLAVGTYMDGSLGILGTVS